VHEKEWRGRVYRTRQIEVVAVPEALQHRVPAISREDRSRGNDPRERRTQCGPRPGWHDLRY
jgi:hypothetical protein